tara:strand:+ start:275 stop:1810 length:1536 start_codon:yes stop_codon:yes gene_type:complete
MGFSQITLNTDASYWTITDASGTGPTVANLSEINNQSATTTISNYNETIPGDTRLTIRHTFETPQYVNKIEFKLSTAGAGTVIFLKKSDSNYIDVINLFSAHTVSEHITGVATLNAVTQGTEYGGLFTRKYEYIEFRFGVPGHGTIGSQTNFVIDYINVFIEDGIIEPSTPPRFTNDYNVEFDDALLDLAGWKNPRFEGSKLTGVMRNRFIEGDNSYGLNPVIEHKTACIFLGKDIDEGDAADKKITLTEIMNHSYVTIDKILLINVETDDVEVVARENMSEVAFNRLVAENFPEGSAVIMKSLEDEANKLKPQHFVKFNQGQLMKVYSYIANADGLEDGVFGGHAVYESKGSNQSIVSGSGLFGFGTSRFDSSSLFNTHSIQFTDIFPAELSFHEANYNTETMGTTLVNATASISSSNQGGSTGAGGPSEGGGFISEPSDIRLKENIIYLRKSISGIPIYTFNYIGRKEKYTGTMAQDLIKLGRTDAVVLDNNGYYSVYYDKIDVNFNII